MSADQPCTDCGGQAAPYTRAERALAVVGLAAGFFIGYIFVDVLANGRVTSWLGRMVGGSEVGREAESYLRAAEHDRRG